MVSVFDMGTSFFGTVLGTFLFLFFKILNSGPLRPFSSIFLFIVCNSSVHATSAGISLTNGLTNLTFRTDGLYDTTMWDF